MVPDRQKVRTDGRTEGRTEWTDGRTHGRRQNYIPPTSSGDKKAHDSQIVRAKEKLKLSYGGVGPANDKHQAPTNGLKLYLRTVIKPEARPTVVQ